MSVMFVAFGGFLGATLRYGTSRFFQNRGLPAFYATLAVNLIGSLLMGIAAQAALLSPSWHSFIVIGFLGAYTTFSTFMLDAVEITEKRNEWPSLLYTFVSLLGGILLFSLGWSL